MKSHLLTILLFGLCIPLLQAQDFQSVQTLQEIPQVWNEETPLYVKGNVQMAPNQLRDLSKTIKETGPNWTVVLTDTLLDTVYEGKSGINAAESILSHGLNNQSAFGSLTDETGTPNANILYISFGDPARNDRRVGYYAAQAYDMRGIGEANWEGNLDQTAISYLKNGRQVRPAVIETIKKIEDQLENKKAQEAQKKEALLTNAKALNERTKDAVEIFNRERIGFNEGHPEVAAKNPEAFRKLKSLEPEVNALKILPNQNWEKTLDRFETTESQVEALLQILESENHESQQAVKAIQNARQSITKANRQHFSHTRLMGIETLQRQPNESVRALEAGHYLQARKLCRDIPNQTKSAIQQAESRERQEESRIRRERQARESTSRFSSSSFSSSSFSSGSGFSSSSFSSGSGFSSSSW